MATHPTERKTKIVRDVTGAHDLAIVDGTRPGHKGQLIKRRCKNRIADEIRFQSRKRNR